MFFAETQNKMLYAVTQHTAAEIVLERADPQKQNMGLLPGEGKISNQQMEKRVMQIYDDFDRRRKSFDEAEADRQDMPALEELEETVKRSR